MTKVFLIADDSPDKRMFLRSILQHAHWDGNIFEATTTEESFSLIDAHPDIAAAFIDYEMPTQNGPAVIRKLRSTNPKAHIALVTATDSKRYEEDAREAGADAFVCSSWVENRLVKALMDFLEEWKVNHL